MTPELKMKVVVKAAGECWHEWLELPNTREWDEFVAGETAEFFCSHCSEELEHTSINHDFNTFANPSPINLNELFRLAEKLKFDVVLKTHVNYNTVKLHVRYQVVPCAVEDAKTPPEALLNALYSAVKVMKEDIIVCPHCFGKGYIDSIIDHDSNYNSVWERDRCYKCNETGTIIITINEDI